MRVRLPFFYALLSAVAIAQQTVNYASIAGRVTDPSGATVEGAQVTARETATNSSRGAVTDTGGRFRFPYLKIGDYRLIVHRDGFGDAARSLTLNAGSAFDLAIPLTVGPQATNLTVNADPEILEGARSEIAGTVSRAEAAFLPLNGRNLLDLALLVPGVTPANTASTQLFAETSAVPGQGLSVAGQRNFSNSFIVDGLSANDDAAGLSGAFYSLDAVEEFQVVTSGGQAEFGRAIGGYVNVVTRSGSNQIHGGLYGYLRNQRFNAANPLSGTVLPLTQMQYGATLSGPVIRDRAFYFANYEERDLNQDGLVTISPVNVTAIDTRLAAVNYGGLPVSTGLYSSPLHTRNFLAKADYELSPADQFTARYSLYSVDSSNSRGAGALSAVSAGAGLQDTDQTAAAGNVWTLSPHTVNELRAQFTSSGLTAPVNDPTGPAVSISGVAAFGTLSASPTARHNRLYELVDNLSHRSGAHSLRVGIDFLYNDLTITYPQSVRGSYSFSSLANFLSGSYNNSGFTQSFGNPVVSQTNPNLGIYAQDEWQVSPRLTLNAGVRYDLQFLKTIATDWNNISPRAGFAWSPWASRHTVVRGSFGIYYDRVPLRALANALLSSHNTTNVTPATFVTVSLSPAQAGAPLFPTILSGLPGGVLVNFSTMQRNMQSASSQQGSLEVERQVTRHSTLSVSYQHLRGLHLVASVNRNAPSCAATGSNNGCRPDPTFGNNKQYSAVGDSHYDGLHVSLVQRPVRWGEFRVSYTWAKALDNVGEFFFSAPIDNANIWKDYGRSDDDQRHRLVVDGAVHARGWQLSGSLQDYSALPFNVVTGANTLQGTAARPLLADGTLLARNAGTGFSFLLFNARLSREFALSEHLKLQGIAEAFNALNHRNNEIPNGTFGAGLYPFNTLPGFGAPTAAGDPRTWQLALRLRF